MPRFTSWRIAGRPGWLEGGALVPDDDTPRGPATLYVHVLSGTVLQSLIEKQVNPGARRCAHGSDADHSWRVGAPLPVLLLVRRAADKNAHPLTGATHGVRATVAVEDFFFESSSLVVKAPPTALVALAPSRKARDGTGTEHWIGFVGISSTSCLGWYRTSWHRSAWAPSI